MALAVMLGACVSGPPEAPAVVVAEDARVAPIQIASIRLTAAGHYVDLRYRVLDPKRAQEALGPGVKPRLIDEKSGAVMWVPSTAKLGSLRQTQNIQKPDHLYFVLFINSAGLKSGSRVTAELGSLTFRNLTVE
ncbi:MAG: hypothetical protein IT482_07020 [Gammaproteobacteria bacterium]|nr:hypothetical protein [Gammaproteobacteria bacterium]